MSGIWQTASIPASHSPSLLLGFHIFCSQIFESQYNISKSNLIFPQRKGDTPLEYPSPNFYLEASVESCEGESTACQLPTPTTETHHVLTTPSSYLWNTISDLHPNKLSFFPVQLLNHNHITNSHILITSQHNTFSSNNFKN